MTWEERALVDTTGRGRNGWFRATRAVVRGYVRNGEPRVTLDVASARPYQDMPPIHLDLAREDAVTLRNLLATAVTASQTIPRYRTACPVCGAALQVSLKTEASAIPLHDWGYDEMEAAVYEVLGLTISCTGATEHTFKLWEVELRGPEANLGVQLGQA